LEKYSGEKLIIGGDFNWVGDEIDRTGPLTCNDLEIKLIMERMISLLDLTDIYRRLNLLRVGYTYTYDNSKGSRIDKFLGTRFDSINYKKSGISDFKLSDHYLIYLEIGIKDKRVKWGRGSWKLNNKILHNDEFILDIKKEIENFKNKGNLDIIKDWDNLKKKF
jgi:hypothetical protein